MRTAWLSLLLCACSAQGPSEAEEVGPGAVSAEALRIHRSALLVDGHNDLPWEIRTSGASSFDEIDISRPQPKLHTDIPRLRQGGVGAQFWSVFVPAETARRGVALHQVLEQIDLVRRMARRYPGVFEMADSADDVERIHRAGRIACLLGVEGGYAIEDSLAVLRMLHELGVRYMTLTHSDTTSWADSATDEPRHGGLAPFGEEVVREMNRLGVLVDISHVSVETMEDALRVSRAPVIASHSATFAMAPHPRNVPDDVLRLVAANRGVVMINFYSGFVVRSSAARMAGVFDVRRRLREENPDDGAFRAAMERWRVENPIERGDVGVLVDHIEHVIAVAGIDCVGLGSDYDGITTLPEGLEDVSCYPRITEELLARGHSAADIRKILGGNALRALREAEEVARAMQEEAAR
jgi:membrane dipeptidase